MNTGWKMYRTGVSAGSYGGDNAFQPGTITRADLLWHVPKRKRSNCINPNLDQLRNCSRMKMCWIRGSLPGFGPWRFFMVLRSQEMLTLPIIIQHQFW